MNFAIFKGEKTITELVTRLYQVKGWGSAGAIKNLAQGLLQANPQLANLASVPVGTRISVPGAAQPVNQAEMLPGPDQAANQPAQPPAPPPRPAAAPVGAAAPAPPTASAGALQANTAAIQLAIALATSTGRATQLNAIFESLKTALPASLSNAVTNAKNSLALAQKPEVQAAAAKDALLAERLAAITQQANDTVQNTQAQQDQFLQVVSQMQQDLGDLLKS